MPLSTNPLAMLVIFLVLTLVLHLILVLPGNVGKIGWKKVDYIWLGFASLGLIGAVSQSRQIAAKWQDSMIVSRAEANYGTFHDELKELVQSPGAVCRTFVRSEYSPPEDEMKRTQSEFDQACIWFKTAIGIFPEADAFQKPGISLPSLPPFPQTRDKVLIDIFNNIRDFYGRSAKSNSELQTIRSSENPTYGEETLILLNPYLLAIALSLRITKVSGEIKFERRASARRLDDRLTT